MHLVFGTGGSSVVPLSLALARGGTVKMRPVRLQGEFKNPVRISLTPCFSKVFGRKPGDTNRFSGFSDLRGVSIFLELALVRLKYLPERIRNI